MKATINGSHTILDYFRLTYSSMSIIRAIVHNIKDIKKCPLATIARIEITPMDAGTSLCTVAFQDGSTRSMEFEDRSEDSYAVPRPSTEIVVNRAEKPKKTGRKRGKR